MAAYGFGLSAADEDAAVCSSDASKKGLSRGWISGAGSAARAVAWISDLLARACSSSSPDSVDVSTSGDGTAGACLAEGVNEESLFCRAIGNLPLFLPTTIGVALTNEPVFEDGDELLLA